MQAAGDTTAGGGVRALPERASVHWRRPMDERRLRVYSRAWTLTTAAHTVPLVLAAVALFALAPLTAPVGLALLAHAWAIPELYANRGAKVVKPRRRGESAAEATALGLLGDLVGHRRARRARAHRTRA